MCEEGCLLLSYIKNLAKGSEIFDTPALKEKQILSSQHPIVILVYF
jgi:hypothetical protein